MTVENSCRQGRGDTGSQGVRSDGEWRSQIEHKGRSAANVAHWYMGTPKSQRA